MTSPLNESSTCNTYNRSDTNSSPVNMAPQLEEDGCAVVEENGTVCGETRTLSIFQEFRQIYDDCIRKMEANKEEHSALRKLAPFRRLVEDLWEQNAMLVETVEELEHEATCRVNLLQNKLDECSEKVNEYLEDIDSLVEVIRRFREKGEVDSTGLKFNTICDLKIHGNCKSSCNVPKEACINEQNKCNKKDNIISSSISELHGISNKPDSTGTPYATTEASHNMAGSICSDISSTSFGNTSTNGCKNLKDEVIHSRCSSHDYCGYANERECYSSTLRNDYIDAISNVDYSSILEKTEDALDNLANFHSATDCSDDSLTSNTSPEYLRLAKRNEKKDKIDLNACLSVAPTSPEAHPSVNTAQSHSDSGPLSRHEFRGDCAKCCRPMNINVNLIRESGWCDKDCDCECDCSICGCSVSHS